MRRVVVLSTVLLIFYLRPLPGLTKTFLRDLETHAFVSQGFIYSHENNFIAEASKDGSFEFTEVGINFTQSIDQENLRLGMQFFARNMGASGNFDAQFDWFYLSYIWSDELEIRFGRTKMPFGLYAEAMDIDAARVTILMPQALYPSQGRDFLLAINGVDLRGYKLLPGTGALEYNLFAGTIFHNDEDALSKLIRIDVTNLNIPYVLGGRLFWETPVSGLIFGGSVLSGRLDADSVIENDLVDIQVPGFLWVFSTEYIWLKWKLAFEFSRWQTKLRSENVSLLDSKQNTSERSYFLIQHRFNQKLSQAFCYSLFYDNVDNRSGRENQQHDISTALRWDISKHWLAKAEVHYMHGTAALYSQLNDGQPLDSLEKDWWAFLLKTTAYF